jgi:hypothetical protein
MYEETDPVVLAASALGAARRRGESVEVCDEYARRLNEARVEKAIRKALAHEYAIDAAGAKRLCALLISAA